MDEIQAWVPSGGSISGWGILLLLPLLVACERDPFTSHRFEGSDSEISNQWIRIANTQDRYHKRLMVHASNINSGSVPPHVGYIGADTGRVSFAGLTPAEVVELMRQREVAMYRAARERVLAEQSRWQRAEQEFSAIVEGISFHSLQLRRRQWAHDPLPANPTPLQRFRYQRESAPISVAEATLVNGSDRELHIIVLQLSPLPPLRITADQQSKLQFLAIEPMQPGESRSFEMPMGQLLGDEAEAAGGTLPMTGELLQASLDDSNSRLLGKERTRQLAAGEADFQHRLSVLDRRLRQLESGWIVPLEPTDNPSAFAEPLTFEMVRQSEQVCRVGGDLLSGMDLTGRNRIGVGEEAWTVEFISVECDGTVRCKQDYFRSVILEGPLPFPQPVLDVLECMESLVYVKEVPREPLLGLAELVTASVNAHRHSTQWGVGYPLDGIYLGVSTHQRDTIKISLMQIKQARLPAARKLPAGLEARQ